MTTKQKTEYGILTVVLVIVLAVLYFYFFGGSSAQPEIIPTGVSAAPVPTGAYLPYGSKLNTNLFVQHDFTSLIKPDYPSVSKSDLGVPNPFNK